MKEFQFIIRDKALVEIKEAYDWYELQVEGLGERFLNKLEYYFEKILENPNQFRRTYKNFKEIYIQDFPFIIIYLIDEYKSTILIIAVFHTSRNPANKYQ
jgi:plasmid stabilization system protein ParE